MRRTIHMLRVGLARVRLYFRAARNWANRYVKPCKNKQSQRYHHYQYQNQNQYQYNQEDNGEHEDSIEGNGNDTLDDIVDHYFDDTETSTPRNRFAPIFEDDTTVLSSTEIQCEIENDLQLKMFLSVSSEVDFNDGSILSKTAHSFKSGSETRTSGKTLSLEMSTMFVDLDDSSDFGYLLMADPCPFKSSKDIQIVLDLESHAIGRGIIK